jgi:hypothetical protein
VPKVDDKFSNHKSMRINGVDYYEIEPGNMIAVQDLSNYEINKSIIPETNLKQQEG